LLPDPRHALLPRAAEPREGRALERADPRAYLRARPLADRGQQLLRERLAAYADVVALPHRLGLLLARDPGEPEAAVPRHRQLLPRARGEQVRLVPPDPGGALHHAPRRAGVKPAA